ncbi:Sulfite oxidase [Hibiscus syriacus]|uniref:Sulfite oxidase n=1 Tax=Hibiscus syriacus TaxID=106335 RepID=A0A6A3AUW1_HIBSY|nr:Sulfite oxidase [Hibiscus syriacus]
MPAISGPSDYSLEPPCHPCLQINAKASQFFCEPFNAEPPLSALVSSYVTPVELFYKRNHGPIPVVDDIERYCVDISGLIETPKTLYMRDVRMLLKYNCAGNRRTAMSKTREVRGVGWDVSSIGNESALFLHDFLLKYKKLFILSWEGGAKLADVFELIGIPKLTSCTRSGGKHVEFVSIDKCKEENGGPYKASIPLTTATNPEADVLLAYEINGEPLNRDHGFPLRVIVPCVIGGHSVKWLDSINIIAEEFQGFFMQKDYKMFPPSVDWGNIDWNTRKPQMDSPVQSVICSLEDVQPMKPGKVTIRGYAVAGGSRGIERVDVSIDGGKTWMEATRFQKTGISYIADHITATNGHGCYSRSQLISHTLLRLWPKLGILNTSWHRVHVRVGHSNM